MKDVNVKQDSVAEQETQGESQPVSPIMFYCRDCQKIAQTEKVGTRYVYKCTQCQGNNVAFGTEKSVRNFFHLK